MMIQKRDAALTRGRRTQAQKRADRKLYAERMKTRRLLYDVSGGKLYKGLFTKRNR